MKIAEEEADESEYFLEILQRVNRDQTLVEEFKTLLIEVNELIAILVASLKTARTNFPK
ncbi:four helix bundle protein [Algoriphagus aestuariicola]|uniref:Four helix bundle protein n=1 Tax=Algoriphagus aestuariicola TaxID=1852016 RepID=A0ABS3BKV0_9BACT|nr:four helix bundle protein [Algoriphagus aestuariicola]